MAKKQAKTQESSEGWALPMKQNGTQRQKRSGAKFHYFRMSRKGYPVSICSTHTQMADFVPMPHTPLRDHCCILCIRYLEVPKRQEKET